jgi:hypothetical protein
MDAATLLAWDRHVVACLRCRAAVDEERRVLAALRNPAASVVPQDLRGMLLAMASSPPAAEADHHPTRRPSAAPGAGSWAPPVPVAPVPVVDRGAPALHRSARRATVFAGLAAGATAAAAWSLVMTGTPTTPSRTPTSPAVQPAGASTAGFATAAFIVRGLGSGSSANAAVSTVGPTVSTNRSRSAESTP